jgi:hypothetical protein
VHSILDPAQHANQQAAPLCAKLRLSLPRVKNKVASGWYLVESKLLTISVFD